MPTDTCHHTFLQALIKRLPRSTTLQSFICVYNKRGIEYRYTKTETGTAEFNCDIWDMADRWQCSI